jgi:lactate permease
MDLFFAALPIGFLIFVMTKKNGLPSTIAFALAALTTYVIRIAYFKTSLPLSHAAIVNGLLQALTPISIVFGAIFFFVALERSGAMQTLRLWLDGVSRNPVAQLMIVGWSFIFLIEGASGFGTPAALAAPILVGLGFPPLRVAVLCIIMNAVPTSFGAVGTPTWFAGIVRIAIARDRSESGADTCCRCTDYPGDRSALRCRLERDPPQPAFR